MTVAGSGDPAKIALTAQILMPRAKVAWAGDAVAGADVVVLAIPLHRFARVDAHALAGKIVVDAMNYWPPVNGRLEQFDETDAGTTEVLQAALPDSEVVKSFSHLTYHEIEGDRRPAGAPGRRGMAVIGPAEAASVVAGMIERIGFDSVVRTHPELGRLLQPGGIGFGLELSRASLERLLDERAAQPQPAA